MPSTESSVLSRLGALPVARFMRGTWQRKPLLIRSALPGFKPPVDRDALFALARRHDVESRLIARSETGWTLKHGPFDRLPPVRRRRWTLLVQGVDLLDRGAQALLGRFRFVPDARLDDLMVSYATDGGGVGPHVDSYDVFLLQAAGRRRWRIGRQRDPTLVADAPLKLLQSFRPEEDWILEPGDLLYLPPGIAHDGVALGECLTYSIGFRAPTFQELLEPWLADFAERATLPGRYADPGLPPTRSPGALPRGMVTQVHRALARERPRLADTRRFLLRHLSEPKAQIVFLRPRRAPSVAQFMQRAARRGVRLEPSTRMMYEDDLLGINGDCVPLPAGGAPLLRTLADARRLPPRLLGAVRPAVAALLREWFAAGWLGYDEAGAT